MLDFSGGIDRINAAEGMENKDEYGDLGDEVNDGYDNSEGF